jgi:heme-degrading monooxygenase HmoA
MFARHVSMQVKANSHKEFTEMFEKEIVPTLRKQQGFRDEILFVVPGGPEVVAISLWDTKQNADAYNQAGYQDVLKTLAKVIERTPELRTFDVASSTFHKIVARAAA